MWADVPDKYFGENRALWWDVKRWAILYYRRYLEKILEFIHYILFKCMHVLNQMGQFFVCKHVTRRQSWGSIQFFLKVFTWKKSLVLRGEKCFCSWPPRGGWRGVQTLQNRIEMRINTAQNNIRNLQTAWFCKNAIQHIKIKISAKSHPKSSKTSSPQTLHPPSPTWLLWSLVQTINWGHSTWFIQLQTNR